MNQNNSLQGSKNSINEPKCSINEDGWKIQKRTANERSFREELNDGEINVEHYVSFKRSKVKRYAIRLFE